MKQKIYHFEVTQTIHNTGTFSVEASSLKEADEKIRNLRGLGGGKLQDMVDWYTDDYVEQMENSELYFKLVDEEE